MRRLHSAFTYANVVATLALFIALGGASYAAVKLPTSLSYGVHEFTRTEPANSGLLVGSFTFSPVDLNCRRSDSEVFLRDVLAGKPQAIFQGAVVVRRLSTAMPVASFVAVTSALTSAAPEGSVTLP